MDSTKGHTMLLLGPVTGMRMVLCRLGALPTLLANVGGEGRPCQVSLLASLPGKLEIAPIT